METNEKTRGHRPRTSWGSIGIGLVVALVILAAVGGLLRGVARGGGPPDCDRLVRQIIQLSKDQRGPFRASIVKIYDTGATSGTATDVRCHGSALLDTGATVGISYRWWLDADGDAFIAYEGR